MNYRNAIEFIASIISFYHRKMSKDNLDPESLQEPIKYDDIFGEDGKKKITMKDIKRNIEALMQKVDLSDITKPECENKYLHTGTICTAYIIFVIVSVLGLIGVFIWKYFRNGKRGSNKKEDSPLVNNDDD